MTEPTTRPAIDPILQALMDAVPLEFTIADGVGVARERMRAVRPPAEMLPQMRIEERVIGHGEIDDIPVRIYWPPWSGPEFCWWSSTTSSATPSPSRMSVPRPAMLVESSPRRARRPAR